VVKRLFFDGIYAEATGTAIGGKHDLAIPACPHKTEAALALVEFAQARAQITLDAAVLESVPITGRNDRGVLKGADFEYSNQETQPSGITLPFRCIYYSAHLRCEL
jgi:hypothetical protein